MRTIILLLTLCFLVVGCAIIKRTQYTNEIKGWLYHEPSELTTAWGQPLLTYSAGESALFLYMRPLSLPTSNTTTNTVSIGEKFIDIPSETSFSTNNYSCPIIFEVKNNRIVKWYYKFGNCVLKKKPSLWDSFWR